MRKVWICEFEWRKLNLDRLYELRSVLIHIESVISTSLWNAGALMVFQLRRLAKPKCRQIQCYYLLQEWLFYYYFHFMCCILNNGSLSQARKREREKEIIFWEWCPRCRRLTDMESIFRIASKASCSLSLSYSPVSSCSRHRSCSAAKIAIASKQTGKIMFCEW